MIVTENLRRRFVDQANLVSGIDNEDAFAQMLHDVLRQLGEIRKIDVLLADQGFAFAHSSRRIGCSAGGDK